MLEIIYLVYAPYFLLSSKMYWLPEKSNLIKRESHPSLGTFFSGKLLLIQVSYRDCALLEEFPCCSWNVSYVPSGEILMKSFLSQLLTVPMREYFYSPPLLIFLVSVIN